MPPDLKKSTIVGIMRFDNDVGIVIEMHENEIPDENGEQSAEDQQHERDSDRKKVLKGAHIAFNDEFSTVECVIRNLSDTGAYIVVQDGILVPNQFVLHSELDGFKIECEIMWRKANTFGVRFISEKIPIVTTRTQIVSHYAKTDEEPVKKQEEASKPAPGSFHKQKVIFGKRKLDD